MKRQFLTMLMLVMLLGSFSVFAGKPVNVNKASAQMLAESLEGIGAVKAKQIVDYRIKHKLAFKTLNDLGKVKGIGSKTLKKNAKYIKF